MNMKSNILSLSKNKVMILLVLIVVLASVLRIYKTDHIPPSLSWDEAAVGFNAWTIANYGRDEYGTFLPLYFQSFGEDKQPIHIYATAIFVKIFGLSEFTTRISTALIGIANVVLIFFLVRTLFKNDFIAILSSLFLAISPQNIFFSRFNHEANFALFFFMLGLFIFFKALKKSDLLPLSFLSFAVGAISYHAAEIIIPLAIVLLIILYYKKFKKEKMNLFITFIFVLAFIIFSFFQPRLLGISRYNETSYSTSEIESSPTFLKTQSHLLARFYIIAENYFSYFDPQYLFIKGDKNPRLSAQYGGEFYKLDSILLIWGVVFIIKKRNREGFLLLALVLIAPIAGSLTKEAPHAGRGAFMMGSWNILSALGCYFLINLFRSNKIKYLISIFIISILFFSMANYLKYYFNDYPKRYAIDWQYGMKQIAQYLKDNPNYREVYMTSIRAQPYIFFLYHLKPPLDLYLNRVVYNDSSDQSSNNVHSFDKYGFGVWNPFESGASVGALYILTPSEYDGLRNRVSYDVKKIIYYPDQSSAFYIVALK